MRCTTIPPTILIDHNLCVRCLKCIRSCPAEILVISKNNFEKGKEKGLVKITEPSLCFECRACEVVCAESAIRIMCEISKKTVNQSIQ